MLRTITIQKRLLVAFGALALLLAITGLVSLQSLSKVRAQADFVETVVVSGLSGIGAIGTGINRNRALTMRLLLSLDITQEGGTFNEINDLREAFINKIKEIEQINFQYLINNNDSSPVVVTTDIDKTTIIYFLLWIKS